MKAKLEHRVQTFWNNVLALCLGLELGPLTFHDLKELAMIIWLWRLKCPKICSKLNIPES